VHMLTSASNSVEFFKIDVVGTTPVWRLKVWYSKNVGFSVCYCDRLFIACEISSSHGGEYDVQNWLLGCTAM
jgi:hypothetical protein